MKPLESVRSIRRAGAVATMLLTAAVLVSCATDTPSAGPETVTITSTQQVPADNQPAPDAESAAAVNTPSPGPTGEAAETAAAETQGATAVAPVPGAYAGAGGPIPAAATPIHTIKSGYGVFKTPSGNIGCDISTAELGCRIANYLQDEPYGRVPGGPRSWVTISGTQTGIGHHGGVNMYMERALGPQDTMPAQIVAYGEVVYHGKYVCASEYHGLTCWDSENGRGAFMSRERTEFF